jgi:hypothetical protein
MSFGLNPWAADQAYHPEGTWRDLPRLIMDQEASGANPVRYG